jgi:hypothetical protein
VPLPNKYACGWQLVVMPSFRLSLRGLPLALRWKQTPKAVLVVFVVVPMLNGLQRPVMGSKRPSHSGML